jgi:formate dehydrogenase maturation protein FdhE
MPPGSSVWVTRRARALHLAVETPHAEEILSTYADLLEVQARVAEAVPVRRWLALVGGAESGPPRLRLDRLPVDELVPLFADFLADAVDLGTDLMKADAGALSGTPGADWLALFGAALTPDRPDEDPPFHVRAFLQPVATTLAAAIGEGIENARGGRCFSCGGAPAVGALQDLPNALGSRSLVCSVCGSAATEVDRLAQRLQDPRPLGVVASSSVMRKPWCVALEARERHDDDAGRAHQVVDEPLVRRDAVRPSARCAADRGFSIGSVCGRSGRRP